MKRLYVCVYSNLLLFKWHCWYKWCKFSAMKIKHLGWFRIRLHWLWCFISVFCHHRLHAENPISPSTATAAGFLHLAAWPAFLRGHTPLQRRRPKPAISAGLSIADSEFIRYLGESEHLTLVIVMLARGSARVRVTNAGWRAATALVLRFLIFVSCLATACYDSGPSSQRVWLKL